MLEISSFFCYNKLLWKEGGKVNTKWIVSDVPTVEEVNKMVEATGVGRLVAAILCVRGFSPEDAVKFINKDKKCIHDPFLLKDMYKAIERINKALENNEKITVYGDYDADGVTSSTIMVLCLKELNANVDYYIPDRETEGYGISKTSIATLSERGTNLIISVDCGITAVEECDYAASLGIETIITDHHECSDTLPKAVAVIDPKRSDCNYPFKALAGVGVALKLCQALLKDKMSYYDVLVKFSDFTAIGSIADIVPLIDENRIICDVGLRKIANSTNVGIQALFDVSGVETQTVNTTKIGFVVAPRINAAGRLESAQRAIDLFLADNYEDAFEIAQDLSSYNTQRQNIEMNILKEAENMLLEKYKDDKIVVLCNKEWHHGVVGIVSSRLTKKYMKPCILLSQCPESNYKGSGRSIEGFSLYDALDYCKDLLVTFGGHELAVGLTIDFNNIDAFRKKINEYADKYLTDELCVSTVTADCELRGRHLNLQCAEELSILQPFGTGNLQPQFYIKNMTVQKAYCIGNEKQHLKLTLCKDGVTVDAIAFGFGNDNNIAFNDTVSVICQLDINDYRNVKSVQLRILDIK